MKRRLPSPPHEGRLRVTPPLPLPYKGGEQLPTRWLLLCVALCLALVSCTLYMDEEIAVDDDEELPVYTGEGYDEVVHIQDEYSDIYYQLNSNVRQFTEQMQRHIVRVKSDPDQLFTNIDFAKDTPKELLPVKGDILVSLETEWFPEGIGNHVIVMFDAGDFYRCVTCVADLDEIFKTYSVDADLMDPEAKARAAGTRSGGEELYELDEKEWIKDTIHIAKSFNSTKILNNGKYATGTLTFPEGEDSIIVTMGIHALMYKDKFPTMTVTIKQDGWWNIDVQGTFEKTITMFEKKNVLPSKAKLRVGPVILKFIVGFDFSAVANFTASGRITGTTTNTTKYPLPEIPMNASLYTETDFNFKPQILENKTDLDFSKGNFSGSLGLRFKMTAGVGLYTRSIGVRLNPYLYMGWQYTHFPKEADKEVIDISKNAFSEFIPKMGAEVVILVDLNLKRLSSNFFGGFIEDIGMLLDLSEYIVQGTDVSIKDDILLGNGKKLKEFTKAWEEYTNHLEDDGSMKEGDANDSLINKLLGPWSFNVWSKETVLEKFHVRKSWYPTVYDNTLAIGRASEFLNNNTTANFKGSYSINNRGSYVEDDHVTYYPALKVTRQKKDGTEEDVGVYWPDNGAKYINYLTYKFTEFTFNIEQLQLGQDYIGYPCYATTDHGEIKLIDRGLPFSAKAPVFSITGIYDSKVTWSYRTADATVDGRAHDVYTFKVKTLCQVSGVKAHNVSSAKLEVLWTNSSHAERMVQEYDRTSKNHVDGEFETEWTFESYEKDIEIDFTPSLKAVDPVTKKTYEITYETEHLTLNFDVLATE